jgi:D-3-phosphoglycerate dehydrogenase
VTKYSLNKDLIRVLLLEGIHPNALKDLTDSGYVSVEQVSGSLAEEELISRLQGVHLLGIRSGTQLTSRVLRAA